MAQPATRRFTVVSTVSACLLLAAGPAAADQCTSAKLRAIANREARLLRCQAKVARSGDPSLEAACDARAVANFPTARSAGAVRKRCAYLVAAVVGEALEVGLHARARSRAAERGREIR